MPKRRRSNSQAAAEPAPTPTPTRAVTKARSDRAQERLAFLVRERVRLSTKIERKRRQIAAFLETMRDVTAVLSSRMPLLSEQHARLSQEIRHLFAELMRQPDLNRRAHRAISEIREVVEQSGLLKAEEPSCGEPRSTSSHCSEAQRGPWDATDDPWDAPDYASNA